MIDREHNLNKSPANDNALWPSKNYYEKIKKIKSFIWQEIYLVEIIVSEINAAVHHTGRAYKLLSVMDYPQPDPKTSLYPHFILLDDGRGINLGRIEQISTEQAFNPPPRNIIYHDQQLLNRLLPQQSRFSHESVRLTSRLALEHLLGKKPAKF